jgi:hypothetical protein
MKHTLQLLFTALTFLALGVFLAIQLLPESETKREQSCVTGEPFMPFLQRFNDDLTFQKHRTMFPLVYVTSGTDSDDSEATYLIESASWVPLSVYDTTGTIVQIVPLADPSGYPDPCGYRVLIDGIHHGLHLVFHFGQLDGEWYLETFEDRSY